MTSSQVLRVVAADRPPFVFVDQARSGTILKQPLINRKSSLRTDQKCPVDTTYQNSIRIGS